MRDITGEYDEIELDNSLTRYEPKVFIGCPTYEGKAYCLFKFLVSLKNLDYVNKNIVFADNSLNKDYSEKIKEYAEKIGVNIQVVRTERKETSKETLAHARNKLKDMFLKGDYDLFLSLEQDVILNTEDLLKLVQHNMDVVSGIVWQILPFKEGNKKHPLLWREYSKREGKMYFLREEQLQGSRLIQIYATSMSCLLIARRVLEKISFRTEGKGWDDVYFCRDLKANGFKVWADTRVRPKHIIMPGIVL